MKLLGRSALAAVLLLLLLAVKKPGYCPEFFLRCPFILLPLCRRDGGCNGDKKCCFYNCRHQCMEPWLSLE
uniref:WAP domain-containing protein n=1 Tax=Ursus americanus TaxID=9643 RepID=A0A452RT34_URSAM